jgi:uncharacterized protein YjbI with pentapeptide repeats
MRFFFRRSTAGAPTLSMSGSSGASVAELPAPEDPKAGAAKQDARNQDATQGKQAAAAPIDAPATEQMPAFGSFAPPKDLVPASQLPSAADALAELFGDGPAEASVDTVRRQPVRKSEVAPAREIPIQTATKPAQTPPYSPVIHLEIAEQAQPIEIVAEIAREAAEAPAAKTLEAEPSPATPPVAEAAVTPAPSVGAQPESPLIEAASPASTAPQAIPPSADLCPEDAATVLAAASEEISPEEPTAAGKSDRKEQDGAEPGSRAGLAHTSSNWAFEETLASHREWVDSKGLHGKKADFANAQLEGLELINVNLRLADLHYANLKSADLLLADLRDACMVRADLEEACLVGANLEGANLEGASLETALGLVPRQLAGANLREASLPAQIAQFPALATFRNASRAAVRFFTTFITLCTLSALAIWKTRDIQLVTDSAILPFLHSAKAAAAMPTAEIFLITPVALFLLYLAFLQQIQRVWGAALELPAVFPDGNTLGEKESGIILGLLRAHFRWMNQDAPSARTLETTLSLLLAYWTVPLMLFLFWARYLTLQEIHGTILQESLAALAAGVAVHATFKVGRPQEKWALQKTLAARISASLRESKPPVLVGILLAIATFISFGTIVGVPHDRSRAPQYGQANIRRWAPTILWTFGYDPYADLTEAQISTPPANWNWSDDTVNKVRGPHLNDPRFRYAQAYGTFFANARLWRADFRGAYLSNSDFRAADLTQSNFQFAIMDSARMNHANLDRSTLQNGHFARTDFRDANLSYASLADTFLMDARFDGASLYDSVLSNGTLIRAVFERADLRNAHIDSTNLEHADLRNAYLWSASVQNSDLKDAELGSAILIGASLRGSDLAGAHFDQTVLNETDLSGALLDGVDMRGAFGLTAYQVCTARSHAGALFDDALEHQIDAQCPSVR